MPRRLLALVAPVLLAGAGLYLLVWVLFAPGTVYAVDYTVGGVCGSTIQTCINSAAPGDTIIVPAGIWTESLTLGKAVSLTGVSRATTIIHALAGQRVLTVTGATIDNRVIISGLTFTGGDILSGTTCTGGDVSNCGGGIVLTEGAQPLIQHAIIEKNAAYRGGGLYANLTGTLQLDHVIFRHNLSTLSGAGYRPPIFRLP